jgi:uncharacterized protein YndB with AHSA1/START domain
VTGKPLKITTPSPREIRITRVFAAPRTLVYRAFTEPALLRRWLFGPNGWSLEVCELDLRPGGKYRYVWHRARDGMRMGASGEFREIAPPARLVSTERFDDPWYPGESLVTVELTERAGVTTLVQTLLYESEAARNTALASPMDQGMAAGYDRLELIALELQASATADGEEAAGGSP